MTASLPLWMWPSDGQASEGNPAGGHGLHETMFDPVARGGLQATGSAGGDDHTAIEILGESRQLSDSVCDAAVHTMQEADAQSSPTVRLEPALGDGVGGGEWGSQDSGNGMALDSATALAVAGAGARSGVGGLGSGQVGPDEVVDGLGLSAAGGASARPSTACGEAMDVVGGIDMQLALADTVAPAADSPSPVIGDPPTSFTYKQRRVWLRNQRRKGTS